MVFKWRDDHTILVLDLLQNEECLWNNQSALYRNKNCRDKALENMVKQLNLPGVTTEDIKLKIKSIRSRYSSELGKVLNSERCGDDVYEPKLFWYPQADAFLRPVCSPRLTSATKVDTQVDSNLDIEIIETGADEGALISLLTRKEPEEQGTRNNITEPGVYVDSVDCENKGGSSAVKNQHTVVKRKRESQLPTTHGLQEFSCVIEKLQKISEESRNSEDEFDFFAKSLAVQLKKMPLDRALICQGKLQQVMIEERMFQINHSSATNRSHQQSVISNPTYSPTPSQSCGHSPRVVESHSSRYEDNAAHET